MTAGTRGRPRDPAVEARTLSAIRVLVAERGTRGVSMSAVADAAGAGKPTLYLRWSGLDDLIGHAVQDVEVTPDQRALVRDFLTALERLSAEPAGGFLIACAADPAWRTAVRTWLA